MKQQTLQKAYISKPHEASQHPLHIVKKQGEARVRKLRPADPTVQRRKDRLVRLRECNFKDAVLFAWKMDWPLNVSVTISWNALIDAGEQNDGHCLGKSDEDREAYVRTELRRLAKSLGFEFVALYAREVGTGHGIHTHLYLFWPSRFLTELVGLLERVTGSDAKFHLPAYYRPTVSRSVCGGWQIDTNQQLETVDSVLGFAEYLTKWNAEAHPAIRGKAYGVSQSISHKARTAPGAAPQGDLAVSTQRGCQPWQSASARQTRPLTAKLNQTEIKDE